MTTNKHAIDRRFIDRCSAGPHDKDCASYPFVSFKG